MGSIGLASYAFFFLWEAWLPSKRNYKEEIIIEIKHKLTEDKFNLH